MSERIARKMCVSANRLMWLGLQDALKVALPEKSELQRTYSKGDEQPAHAPWGPKEHIYADERAGKVCVASVGCVGAASCSFDSCSADRASHQEIGIISARSRQKDAGFPLIF
ncbi:hypothetical protein ZEAMMB73_Zm00001d009598 [Zea mays]|uniref:Uncharacterized protein n=1 Tax=Zea mays TaxID=4577 RepID=A0A1D6FKI4_MAIZE|nr:hypothetical protein ZEAMMB73_Zm00001d009598 [Zea mays]